jgi:hypothetical protein
VSVVTGNRIIERVGSALGPHAAILRVAVGTPPDGTMVVGTLHADGGAQLDAAIARWRAADPHADPAVVPVNVLWAVAWATLTPLVRLVAAERLVTDTDLGDIALETEPDDGGPWRAWWPAPVSATTCVEPEVAYADLVARSLTAFAPLIDAVRQRVRVGPRALWCRLVDVFADVGPRYQLADPSRARAEIGAFTRAAAGTRLGQQLRYVEFEHRGTARQIVRMTACCLAYTRSSDADPPPHPSSVGPWSAYCMTCPLVPEHETVRRARWWLDHPDAGSAS